MTSTTKEIKISVVIQTKNRDFRFYFRLKKSTYENCIICSLILMNMCLFLYF